MMLPQPGVLLTSSDTLALSHVVPAADRIATPRLCLAVASRPLSNPPPSWATTDTVITSAPVAPGGLELAENVNCEACETVANTFATSSAEIALDASAPPQTASVGLSRASTLAAGVAPSIADVAAGAVSTRR